MEDTHTNPVLRWFDLAKHPVFSKKSHPISVSPNVGQTTKHNRPKENTELMKVHIRKVIRKLIWRWRLLYC